jgi:hypothetical protein
MTFCRNEANSLVGGSFSHLKRNFYIADSENISMEAWNKAINEASISIGIRDRIGQYEKQYISPWKLYFIGKQMLARGKVRSFLAIFDSRFGCEEFRIPRLYIKKDIFSSTMPVFKLNLSQDWILNVFNLDTRMQVIHNIRHPKAFLRSWSNRYAAGAGEEKVFANNLKTLPRIYEHFGYSGARFQKFSVETLLKSELWRWRYVHEPMFLALNGHERYALVTYEEYEANPAKSVERIFNFAGLDFDHDVQEKLRAMKNTLFASNKVKELTHEVYDEVIDEVLRDSPLLTLW